MNHADDHQKRCACKKQRQCSENGVYPDIVSVPSTVVYVSINQFFLVCVWLGVKVGQWNRGEARPLSSMIESVHVSHGA